MVKYFLLTLFMLVFYELLGQCLLSTLKIKKMPFNFFIGLSFHMAVLYLTTSLLTASNCSFNILLVSNIVVVFFLLIFIVNNHKELQFCFGIVQIFELIITTGMALMFSYNTSLGDIHGFDSVYYLNLVVGSIGQSGVQNYNSFGGYGLLSDASQAYIFQSYYYFCSVVVFFISKIFSIFHQVDFYSTIYIWIFQIIFTASMMSTFINACNKYLNNKNLVTIILLLFAVFGYGKLYWNSVFGFYGNTFKVIVMAYISMFTIDYFKNEDNSYKYLIFMLILAGCSFTSTFIFIALLFVFAWTFVMEENRNIFKYYGLLFSLPICNLFCIVAKKPIYICAAVGVVFATMMWLLNDLLITLFKDKKTKIITLGVISILMFVLSRFASDGLFDFSGLLNNLSEKADMTLFYFSYDYYPVVKIVSLFTACLYIFIGCKDKYAKLVIVLIICFFNPFCCNILNKFNVVYYRAYDIIFNPFTAVYYSYYICNSFNNKKVMFSAEIVIILCTLVNLNNYKPNYYHESFELPDNINNYDFVNKMDKYEVEMLLELKYYILTNEYDIPFICSPDIRTFSAIHTGEYVYGRSLTNSLCESQGVCEVYKVFYPVSYYGEIIFNDIDYEKSVEYLKNTDIDILVLDKEQIYFDKKTGNYYPLYLFVENSLNPIFSNEKYAIYRVN